MSSYVSEELRELVAIRAEGLCEYCLIHEEDTFFKCHIDHIISLKHGGQMEADNLAYACAVCNRNKGSDIGSILLPSRKFIRFFNPRTDNWAHHFTLESALIKPLTDIGKATTQVLGFNNDDRLLERQTLIAIQRYPSKSALSRITK